VPWGQLLDIARERRGNAIGPARTLQPIDLFRDVVKLPFDGAKIDRRRRAGDRCAGGAGFGKFGIESLLPSRNLRECFVDAVGGGGLPAAPAEPLKLAIDAHDRVGEVARRAVAAWHSGGPPVAAPREIIDPPLHLLDLPADRGKTHIGRADRLAIPTGLVSRRRDSDRLGLTIGLGIDDDRVQPLANREPGAACGVASGFTRLGTDPFDVPRHVSHAGSDIPTAEAWRDPAH
jgi:hypothetical protein